jgi:hypothetical protein
VRTVKSVTVLLRFTAARVSNISKSAFNVGLLW